MLDGPGMIREPDWVTITLTHSNHNFSFTVQNDWYTPTVTGSCRDQEGTAYESDAPIPIPLEAMEKLWDMKLEELPDLIDTSKEVTVSLKLVDTHGEYKKEIDRDLAEEIYEILLPCFVNQ